MVPLVPVGPNGTLLKSCCPLRTWNADNFGCTLEVRSMFNVSCDCLINLHRNKDGNYLSHMHSPEIVWFLKN